MLYYVKILLLVVFMLQQTCQPGNRVGIFKLINENINREVRALQMYTSTNKYVLIYFLK